MEAAYSGIMFSTCLHVEVRDPLVHQCFMPLSQVRKGLVMKRARESGNDATLHAKEFAVEVDFVKWQHG